MAIEKYENRIICGDNVEVMRGMPDNCIDLTVTSPPYDNLRTYKGFTWDFEGIAKELYRVTKQGGVVVWVVGDATIKGSFAPYWDIFKGGLELMSIIYKKNYCLLYCDICCEAEEERFRNNREVVAYKKLNGWIGRKEKYEWIEVCPKCQKGEL